MSKTLGERSKEAIWHPFTQMQISDPPIGVVKGDKEYLVDENGDIFIDAISSWWTSLHGHSHPYIAEKIAEQARQLEHVIFAGFTHEPAVKLAERLLKYIPGKDKVFFSDNGSTAVEVAIKMAFQYWYNLDQKKTKIIAFESAYHGDTFGAMSVGSRDEFVAPFSPFLFDVEFVPSPALNAEGCLTAVRSLVKQGDVAAIIFEPLVQGAGGMLMYSEETLDEIIAECRTNDVLVVADEVMTGFYRTGKMFASDYLAFKPDIYCLSKGLTGGVMAMGLTVCSNAIYNEFLSDDFSKKTFFHGHSFTANPIACATANASLDLLEKRETQRDIQRIIRKHSEFKNVLEQIPELINVRQRGTILAFDVASDEKTSYHNSTRDTLYKYFIEKGILMRPLGNTLYVLPPYCISDEALERVYKGIKDCFVK